MMDKRCIHYTSKLCSIPEDPKQRICLLQITKRAWMKFFSEGMDELRTWSGVRYARGISLFECKNMVVKFAMQH
jgi:hypothetical protein